MNATHLMEAVMVLVIIPLDLSVVLAGMVTHLDQMGKLAMVELLE